MKKILSYILIALVIAGCTKEYENPNAATADEVLKSPSGLMGMLVGIRTSWTTGGASALFSAQVSNGLSTGEMTVLNTGNATLAALESGLGSVNGANSTIANLWTSANIVKVNAQKVADNASNISDPDTRAYVEAYSAFFKALAIGTLAQFWEQVTTEVISAAEYISGKRPTFKSRAATLDEAVALLTDAERKIASINAPAAFTSRVGSDIDLKTAIPALIARFSLMNGKFSEALTAANKVPATAPLSVFKFDLVNQNSPFRSGFVTNNVVGGLNNFGLKGDLLPISTDARIPFYLGSTTLSKVTGFFKSDTDPIPVFLPGEITLIKAEVHARQDRLTDAVAELNKILTKSSDPSGVTAKLAAYSGANTKNAILFEIYKQRCIELYLSGLKLDDSRRFERPGPGTPNAERNRNFYPYPNVERDNNSNTPADPAV